MYAAKIKKHISAEPLKNQSVHPANTRQAIIVLGMHRSGTSAFTKVLSLCGATLPRHPLAGPRESNARGHWEPLPIVDAHEQFLTAAGRRWDDILEFPESMFRSKLAAKYERHLTDLALREFGDSPMFILKDPRVSRLMHLWRPVFKKINAAPYAVIAVRNPLEVADSLERRDGWDQYRALVVWLRYMLAAERDTRDLPRCFIRYDRLIEDWRATVGTIENRLEISFSALHQGHTAEEIDAFLSPEMRHHKYRPIELLARGDIADCVKRAYCCFSLAADTGEIDYAALDSISDALDGAGAILRRIRHRQHKREEFPIDIPHDAKRDALLALVLAELGQTRDSATWAEYRLKKVLTSRSWRLTRVFQFVFDVARRLTLAIHGLLVKTARSNEKPSNRMTG
jgi:hypothetical protein